MQESKIEWPAVDCFNVVDVWDVENVEITIANGIDVGMLHSIK
jgi:hypothetical protein